MKQNLLKVHAALLLVNIIYAASYTISKELMPGYFKPSGLILLRVASALALLFIYFRLGINEKIKEKRHFVHLALCGFFGVALNMLMFFEGLARTSPINASLIMVTTPMLVILIGFMMKLEKVTPSRILGILIGTGGAFMLIASKGTANGNNPQAMGNWLGDLFIFINAASYAVYLVIVRPLMKIYNPVTVMLWSFSFGILFVMPFGFNELMQANWHALTPSLWGAVLFTLIATTFIAYILNAWALQSVSSSVVGSYVYLQPVLGTAIAVFFGNYPLHWQHFIYAALIFTGVFLVSKPVRTVNSYQ